MDRDQAGQLNELEREQLIFEQMEKAEIDKRRYLLLEWIFYPFFSEEMRKQMNKSKRKSKADDSNDEFNNDEYTSSSESEGTELKSVL